MRLDLAPGDAHDVVVRLALLEVRVGAEELDVLRAVHEAAAVLDDLLERDARPAGRADGALAPGRVDQLVAVAGVLVDLLDAAGARALEADDVALAREQLLVLQVGEREALRLVHQPFNVEEELVRVDLGDAAVVAHEEVRVGRDLVLDQAVPGQLAVIRELQHVDHVWCLLLEHVLPADLGEVAQSCCVVILLEALSGEDWVRIWQRHQLKFGRLLHMISIVNSTRR